MDYAGQTVTEAQQDLKRLVDLYQAASRERTELRARISVLESALNQIKGLHSIHGLTFESQAFRAGFIAEQVLTL